MKTRLLIIIMFAIFGSCVFFILYSTNDSSQYEISSLGCEEKYIQRGNECHLDPAFIETNTIIIYDVTTNSETRLSVTPSQLVVNLTNGNTVTFVNDGLTSVNIFDNAKEL